MKVRSADCSANLEKVRSARTSAQTKGKRIQFNVSLCVDVLQTPEHIAQVDQTQLRSDVNKLKMKFSRVNHHKDLLVLNTGASNTIFFNRELLEDIKQIIPKLFNTGENPVQFKQMGELHKKFDYLPLPKEGYYFDEGAVANLLLLAHIVKEFDVYLNTAVDNALYVLDGHGKYLRFGSESGNLYGAYLGGKGTQGACYGFTTVKGQKALFSELDCRRAEAVRNLQEHLGYPSDKDFANAIDYNMLGTCEFNRRDIRIARKIFGPCRAALQGKWTKRGSKMD